MGYYIRYYVLDGRARHPASCSRYSCGFILRSFFFAVGTYVLVLSVEYLNSSFSCTPNNQQQATHNTQQASKKQTAKSKNVTLSLSLSLDLSALQYPLLRTVVVPARGPVAPVIICAY